MINEFIYISPIGCGAITSRFCEEIWTQNPAELLLIRTKAIICEQLFGFETQGCVECKKCIMPRTACSRATQEQLPRSYFLPPQILHKLHAQLIFLG